MSAGGDLCERLGWDSEFFGVSIARVLPARLDRQLCDAIFDWCRSQRIDCLYFLGKPDDAQTARAVDAGGFQLVGIRVTLARAAGRGRGEVRGVVRRARIDDIPALREIAASAHRDTRFHADGRFDAARADELYATWIENSVRGYANEVLVADRDGTAIGYVTLHVDADDNAGGTATARIGLFAVDASHRHQGVGRALLRAAADAVHTRATSVVTAGRNVAALGLYKSEGFETTNVSLWYHRWFDHGRR